MRYLGASRSAKASMICREVQSAVGCSVTEAVLDSDSFSEFLIRLQLVCPICALCSGDVPPDRRVEKQAMPCEYAFLQRPFSMDALANTIRGTARWCENKINLILFMTDWPTSRHGLIW